MQPKATVWGSLLGTPFTVRDVQAGAWRTRVVEAGEGSPLVLLHGTGGHAEAYARNVPALAARHHVVVPDFAGHGYSELAAVDLEISHYVDQVLALLDALAIDAAHIAGESLGGWVAARLAAHHPERVRSLVLNTPGGTMADPAVMERIRTLTQAAADDPTDERIRARLEWLMADPASVTDELVAVRQAIYRRPGFADSIRHVLCLQDVATRARNLLTPDELGRIIAPTLVVWTSDDPSGPPAEGRRMADAIPGAEFTVVERAGHWPQWEQPDTFDDLLTGFLGRHDDRSTP